jgi:DNA-binding response OmpR family regulator
MLKVMRILVIEPHAEVRALLGHVVERLGHEAVFPSGRHGEVLPDGDVDVLLLEPADSSARTMATRLRRRRQELPIVCASIYPDFEPLDGLRPFAYLVKPFALGELERALCAAVESIRAPAKLAS